VSFVEKPIDPPLKEYPTGTPIMGESIATVYQLYAYAINANPNPQVNKDFYAFCNAFLEIGKQEGVRGDIAFCQSCKETGFFKFDGDALPEWNNYAGLGVTGAKDENGIPVGEKFETPEIGILAQIQHLKAYACEEPLNTECVDNRFKYIRRGRSPYWEWLGKMENPKNVDGIYPPEEQQGWAVQGRTYGHDIINMYNKMIELPTDDPNVPIIKDKPKETNNIIEILYKILELLKEIISLIKK
jgi:hypothetical protein